MNVGVRGVLGHTWCLIVIRKFHGFLSWYGSKIQESEWWMSPNANVIAVMSLNSLLTLLSSQSLFPFHGTEWFLPVRIFVSWKKGATSLSASEVQNCMTRLELSWLTIALWFGVAEMSGNQKDVFDCWTWFRYATGRDNLFLQHSAVLQWRTVLLTVLSSSITHFFDLD